ncbi:MAG TPA: hypothetical protein VNT03_08535 [Baekduia sp.]|nr:hypothetical protein [Baekduia sp.]
MPCTSQAHSHTTPSSPTTPDAVVLRGAPGEHNVVVDGDDRQVTFTDDRTIAFPADRCPRPIRRGPAADP